jgi:hypothetical protein
VPHIDVPTLKEFAEQAVLDRFQAMLDGMAFTIFDYAAIHKWYGARDFPNKGTLHVPPYSSLKLGT